MKRAILIGGLSAATILSAFSSCGQPTNPMPCDGETLMSTPHLCPDRGSIGFALEFNSGTFIGTKPQESLRLTNGSTANLDITAISYSGDPAFTYDTSPDAIPATIAGNKNMLVRVVFAPTEARRYTGKLTVQSNAANGAERTFDITGCGVPVDGGIPAECRTAMP